MRNRFVARRATPILALAFCFGIMLGGSLPELGNLAVYLQGFQGLEVDHFYNLHFLVAGILGVIICGITLYRRLLQVSTNRMVNRR